MSSVNSSMKRRVILDENKSKVTSFFKQTQLHKTTDVDAMKEVEGIQTTIKEGKDLQKGIKKYLEIMSSQPNLREAEVSISAIMEDRQINKDFLNNHLKNPENVEKMK